MPAKILVVEDEILFERVISHEFRKQIVSNKYKFIFAHNGKEALEKIKSEQKIDLIITDIRMPEMDGLELLEELNNQRLNFKAIIITAYTDSANIRRSMQQGAYDFISKPFELDVLKEAIEHTLKVARRVLEGEEPANKNVKARKLHPASLVKAIKEVKPSLRLGFVSQAIETLSFEELEEISYLIEAQKPIAQEVQEELDNILSEKLETREIEKSALEQLSAEDLLKLYNKGVLNGSCIETRYVNKTLASGQPKTYGPYYFIRWQEGEKFCSKMIGKEDPRQRKDFEDEAFLGEDELEQNSSMSEETLSKPSQNSQVDRTGSSSQKKIKVEVQGSPQTPVDKPRPPIRLYGSEFDKLNSSKPKQN